MYKIVFDDNSNLWFMNGVPERFVGDHLHTIAKENNLTTGKPSPCYPTVCWSWN